MMESADTEYKTYAPEAFYSLKKLFDCIDAIYTTDPDIFAPVYSGLGDALTQFLHRNDFEVRMREIQDNTSNSRNFRKRFFLWFDGFRVVKFLNYAHENFYERVPVQRAVLTFFENLHHRAKSDAPPELLKVFRKWDLEFE